VTGERVVRRLAAILAADVVGYSRLMGRHEADTLARLKSHRSERLDPLLSRHDGRLVKLTGDGILAEFPSAVAALSAAIEFQQAVAEANQGQPTDKALVFRIGLHLGDLIVEGDDLYGDGVNVAARLEGEAPPGGIVISRTVHEAVEGRVQASFDDLGSLALRNIERPVQAFGVKWLASDWPLPAASTTIAFPTLAGGPLPLPDKPSIAVLPFQNMSGDPEQEYFADGMVEEIITALSRNKALFVIARNSSFAYKGKSPDIRQVGRELGVRYVLEGSVRKSANRVRIAGQLIEASTGAHIWAERFDGDLADIFELQDKIASSIIAGVAPSVDIAEQERANRKTGNLQAYDYYLRSRAAGYRFTKEGSAEALTLSRKAVALDPNFALGHAMIALTVSQRFSSGWVIDQAGEREEAERALRCALALDRQDARVLLNCGTALYNVIGDFEEAAAHFAQAVKIDPNYAVGWAFCGAIRNSMGDPETAIGDIERALRLSPIDITKWYPLFLMGRAHILCGRYEEALPFVEASLRLQPNHVHTFVDKVVANFLAGRVDASREALATFQKLRPEIRASTDEMPFLPMFPAFNLKYREALRLAGLPE
jgi:TolB-like protein/class 3 adenylate cyclase/Flp pilus assembly protein TadD